LYPTHPLPYRIACASLLRVAAGLVIVATGLVVVATRLVVVATGLVLGAPLLSSCSSVAQRSVVNEVLHRLLMAPFVILSTSFHTSGTCYRCSLEVSFLSCMHDCVANLVWSVFILLLWSLLRGCDTRDALFLCCEVTRSEYMGWRAVL
jgi:hypothetical protein